MEPDENMCFVLFLAAQEIRRKQRDAKKFGKALQTERRQDKEKRKRDDLQSIEKWRKNRQHLVRPQMHACIRPHPRTPPDTNAS